MVVGLLVVVNGEVCWFSVVCLVVVFDVGVVFGG